MDRRSIDPRSRAKRLSQRNRRVGREDSRTLVLGVQGCRFRWTAAVAMVLSVVAHSSPVNTHRVESSTPFERFDGRWMTSRFETDTCRSTAATNRSAPGDSHPFRIRDRGVDWIVEQPHATAHTEFSWEMQPGKRLERGTLIPSTTPRWNPKRQATKGAESLHRCGCESAVMSVPSDPCAPPTK